MSNDIAAFLAGIVVGMFVSSMIYSFFVPNEMLSYKEDAIKAGVGEYNPETGEFRFKTLPEKN